MSGFTVADQDVTPRPFPQHPGEILGGAAGRAIGVDRDSAGDGASGADRDLGLGRRIHRRHEIVAIEHLALGLVVDRVDLCLDQAAVEQQVTGQRHGPPTPGRRFEITLASRAAFARLLAAPPKTMTDIQRAARFADLQRLMFGGKPAHLATPGQMGPSTHHPAQLTAARMRRLIRAAHERLQGVHIECLDWARLHRPRTLFYLDPPYLGHEADYGKGMFSVDDFARMAELLRGIEGRFILSLNDTPEVRAMFEGFEIKTVETRYSVNVKATRRAREVLISNSG